MTNRTLSASSRILSALLAGVLVLLSGTLDLRAQRFENIYTGTAGWGVFGVQPVAGGYIAAGITNNGTADVYLVKFDFMGAIVWSNSYDLGTPGNPREDYPRGMTVCANGDIVVVGQTTLVTTPPTPPVVDIFMLRVAPNGQLTTTTCGAPAAHIYGSVDREEDAWRVIETQYGDPYGGPARAGDLVICGRTGALQGAADAYMLRVSNCGTIVWDYAYRNSRNNDEDLYGLAESKVGPGANLGDIIAVGYSRGFGPGGAMIMRVNGFNGTIGAAPEGIQVIMDNDGQNSAFHSVQELQTAPNAGQIVAAGWRSPVGGSDDIYVRKTTADPCVPIADALYGVGNGVFDIAWDIKEILATGGGSPNLTVGNLVMTGETEWPGSGSSGAFLLEIAPNLASVSGAYDIFGTGGEWGRSVHPVYNAGGALPLDPTNGFVICGFSWGTPTGLYIVKTDVAGTTTCSNEVGINESSPNLPQLCWPFDPEWYDYHILVTPSSMDKPGVTEICRFSWTKPAVPGASIVEESTVETFPNPIVGGRDLEVAVIMDEAAPVEITVVDAVGRQVVRRTENLPVGESRLTLSTEGWASGTYLVGTTLNGRMQTRRVVVIGR